MSGTWKTLTASDGHQLSAYEARPKRNAWGGLIVVQEIFGVNAHVRSVADGFAAEGLVALAPAIFDRAEKGVELDYDEPGLAKGRDLAMGLAPWDGVLLDLEAARAELAAQGLKVFLVGYCFGGTLAWMSAHQLPLAASVGYYGGRIPAMLDKGPRCPLMLHFGEKDAHIPLTDVDAIRAAYPQVPVHVYPAGHGFNRDVGKDYDPECARQARERTLEFFRQAP